MGVGIGAVIPLEFRESKDEYSEDNFRSGFIEHYNRTETESCFVFKIHEDFLLKHYKGLLKEFYRLIGVDYSKYCFFGDDPALSIDEETANISDMASFLKEYDSSAHNGSFYHPYVESIYGMVSCRIGMPTKYWVFYGGTYKVFFENYATLGHLDNLISNVIDNPLARLVRFAEIG